MTTSHIFHLLLTALKQISDAKQKPVRMGINGIEGTGKTVFAEQLTAYFQSQGQQAQHISIDGFHFNKAHRYRQGRDSAKGYYEDSYDEHGFVSKVLLRSQQYPPSYIPASHDLETDEYLSPAAKTISNDTFLITDGAYLFKPVYRDHWDVKIYLKTDFQTALNRGVLRDAESLGGKEAAAEKFALRYHKASAMYIAENKPEELADLVIDMTDFDHLVVLENRLIKDL